MKLRHLIGLAPLTLYLVAFTGLPVLSTLVMSLRNPDGSWGLSAFRTVVAHFQFAEAVVNTLVITAISLALEMCLGLALALSLSGRSRVQNVFSVLFLIPLGVPTIVAAAAMRYVFGMVGYLNEALYQLGLTEVPIDWTGSRWLALLTVSIADAWKVTPLVMLILLAGLKGIPRDVYEAAHTDGAGSGQQFLWLTLPLLKPAISMAVIIRGIDAFRIFALPMALVGRNLPVLSTYTYVEYLEYGNPHTAAASSAVLFFMVLIALLTYLRLATNGEAPV